MLLAPEVHWKNMANTSNRACTKSIKITSITGTGISMHFANQQSKTCEFLLKNNNHQELQLQPHTITGIASTFTRSNWTMKASMNYRFLLTYKSFSCQAVVWLVWSLHIDEGFIGETLAIWPRMKVLLYFVEYFPRIVFLTLKYYYILIHCCVANYLTLSSVFLLLKL